MTTAFSFIVEATDGAARRGIITTPHGSVATPAFMPVGTAGSVKAMLPESVRATGAEIVLGNTYHLMLRPSAERIDRLGGLHKFMNWDGPILTDSGGYQVMSLAKLRKLSEDGVLFQSHIDGAEHLLTPERAIEIQALLGADIAMVLDECTPFPASEQEAADSMALSLRWAARSKAAFDGAHGRALFGIVQGGMYPDLRAECAAGLIDTGFDGYAIGGLSVGEDQATMFGVLDRAVPQLPETAPRYLMGAGKPLDLLGAVSRGIDMFDCVLPTRSGRNGQAFTRRGTVNLKNARHVEDSRPLDESCDCPACTQYSRAYLHHAVRLGEINGAMLLSWHNLRYYQALMREMRDAISEQRLAGFAKAMAAEQGGGDIEPL